MQKVCGFCGCTFEAKRASAKYHDATCRQRAKRSGGGDVVKLVPVAGGDGQDSEEKPLVTATRITLEQAGVLNTVPGQSALILAAKVAAGQDTLAGLSSGVKQLEASVSAALSSVNRADQLDEVNQRRDKKLRDAGRA